MMEKEGNIKTVGIASPVTSKDDEEEKPSVNQDKVDILFKATGNAPILKNRRWLADKENTVAFLYHFIRKRLKVDSSESLFLYVNQSFAPSPDHTLGNLYECYGTDGKLIIHYCKTQAWG